MAQVRQRQNHDDEAYARALEFDRRVASATMQMLTSLLIDELDPQDDDRVLDLGAGTGRVALMVAPLVARGCVVGLDVNVGMLALAKDKVRASGIDNVRLVRGRAESIPFCAEAFERACMMVSLHHFRQPAKALAEIRHVLKEAGLLVTLDPVLREGVTLEDERLNKLIEEAFQQAHGPYFRLFSAIQLMRLLSESGFSVRECQTQSFNFDQRGVQGIPMGPHWLQSHQLLRERGEEELLKRFEEQYFMFWQAGEALRVKGTMTFALIKAVKG